MRRRRVSAGAGVVGSIILMVVGAAMALTRDGADAATFGWFLVAVGALALVANLIVAARTR
jgi:Zn-dependent protease